jgi:hypothetical protein
MKKKPTLKSLKNKAWKLCSEYVRRKDADAGGFCGCYTCGAPIHWKLEAQAGHAIGGRTNSVLLDVDIIRPQCVACNVFRRGMYQYSPPSSSENTASNGSSKSSLALVK